MATKLAMLVALAGAFAKRRELLPFLLPVRVSAALAVLGGLVTYRVVPHMVASFLKANLTGIDLNKATTMRDGDGKLVRPVQGPKIPEAMGVISFAVYLICMFLFLPVPFFQEGIPTFGSPDFPHAEFARLLCSLLCVSAMSMLGFADNVLDLRWRDRLVVPLAASLPLIICYSTTGGVTTIKVPRLAQALLGLGGRILDIGPLYYVYIAMLSIFCVNAVNILAGVNGLEVGQTVVIACTVLAHNALQVTRWPGDSLVRDNNLFSVFVVLPFVGCSLGLLAHNWYPSRVFVGDTYCYFGGMTLAVAGVLGHFSKTLLLFMVPQIANFVYSLPQLVLIIPCPRHRMPGYLPDKDQLVLSTCEFNKHDLPAAGKLVYALLTRARLVHAVEQADGAVVMSNLTIINFVLYICGPMHEAKLTCLLLLIQAMCSVLAFAIRYPLAALLYDVVE